MSTLDEKLKSIVLDIRDISAVELDDSDKEAIEQIKQAFVDDGWIQTRWQATTESLNLARRASGIEEAYPHHEMAYDLHLSEAERLANLPKPVKE